LTSKRPLTIDLRRLHATRTTLVVFCSWPSEQKKRECIVRNRTFNGYRRIFKYPFIAKMISMVSYLCKQAITAFGQTKTATGQPFVVDACF